MNSKPSKNSKSYKTAAILFSISGLIFIIVGVVSGKIGIFLPIGIALVILSIGFWQRSRKLTNNEHKHSSE
jgi:membrane-bound ClpP family serine protease